MTIDDKTQKWMYFFRLLDTNKDGVLEPIDIINMVNRVFDLVPHHFTEADQNYMKYVTLKHFNMLVMEARAKKDRKITMWKWIALLKKNNEAGYQKSQFIRWFSTCAVRFMFDLCDHNKDGYIDYNEFKILSNVVGIKEEDIQYAFAKLDENKDDKISRIEIYQAIREFFESEEVTNKDYVFGNYNKIDDAYVSKLLSA